MSLYLEERNVLKSIDYFGDVLAYNNRQSAYTPYFSRGKSANKSINSLNKSIDLVFQDLTGNFSGAESDVMGSLFVEGTTDIIEIQEGFKTASVKVKTVVVKRKTTKYRGGLSLEAKETDSNAVINVISRMSYDQDRCIFLGYENTKFAGISGMYGLMDHPLAEEITGASTPVTDIASLGEFFSYIIRSMKLAYLGLQNSNIDIYIGAETVSLLKNTFLANTSTSIFEMLMNNVLNGINVIEVSMIGDAIIFVNSLAHTFVTGLTPMVLYPEYQLDDMQTLVTHFGAGTGSNIIQGSGVVAYKKAPFSPPAIRSGKSSVMMSPNSRKMKKAEKVVDVDN